MRLFFRLSDTLDAITAALQRSDEPRLLPLLVSRHACPRQARRLRRVVAYAVVLAFAACLLHLLRLRQRCLLGSAARR